METSIIKYHVPGTISRSGTRAPYGRDFEPRNSFLSPTNTYFLNAYPDILIRELGPTPSHRRKTVHLYPQGKVGWAKANGFGPLAPLGKLLARRLASKEKHDW